LIEYQDILMTLFNRSRVIRPVASAYHTELIAWWRSQSFRYNASKWQTDGHHVNSLRYAYALYLRYAI